MGFFKNHFLYFILIYFFSLVPLFSLAQNSTPSPSPSNSVSTTTDKSKKKKTHLKKKKKSSRKTTQAKTPTPSPTPMPIESNAGFFTQNKKEEKELNTASYLLGFKEGKTILEMNYNINFDFLKMGVNDGFKNSINESLYGKKDKVIPFFLDMVMNDKTIEDKKDVVDAVSYIIGVDYGKDSFTKFFPLSLNYFVEGIKDGFNGERSKEDLADTNSLNTFYNKMTELQLQSNNSTSEFLATVKGTQNLSDGIKYKIVKKGKGKTPTMDDTVNIVYSVKDVKGSLFVESTDSTHGDSIRMKDLSRGAQIALMQMKEGAQVIFYIPAPLVYSSLPGDNYALEDKKEIIIFEVALLGVKSSDDKTVNDSSDTAVVPANKPLKEETKSNETTPPSGKDNNDASTSHSKSKKSVKDQ